MMHHDRVETAQERIELAKVAKVQVYGQIVNTKHSLADLRIQMEKAKTYQKFHLMGTLAIEKAKQRKLANNISETEHKLKWAKFTEDRFKERINSAESKKKEVVERNMKKNYEILKSVHRRRFEAIQEHKEKKQTLEAKLAKAEANRKKVLADKIERARVLTEAARFVKELPVTTAVKVVEKFEESKIVESKTPVKSTQTEIEDKEPSNKKANLDLGFTVKKRKGAISKPNAFAWIISRKDKPAKAKNVLNPQTDSESDEMDWEKI
jgi:hypothetical protein